MAGYNIKKLLEKWAALEPDKCKRETRPNKDWHEEFEDYYLIMPDRYLVYSEVYPGCWTPSEKVALMKIQWAIQQAIIEKGWYFETRYQPTSGGYQAEVGNLTEHSKNNMAEALLAVYLRVLEAHA